MPRATASDWLSRPAVAAVAANLCAEVDALLLGQTDHVDLSDSRVRTASKVAKQAVALVGIDKRRELFWKHVAVFSKFSIDSNKAKCGAGGPTKKAKNRRPRHNPKG